MSDAALLSRQIVAEQKMYWRNPLSAIFSFLFPIMFLLIFASTNSGEKIDQFGGVPFIQYYLPSILAFGVLSVCFTNLAINLCTRRDLGMLKRKRGTPLPAWAMIAGLLGNAFIVSVVLVALTAAIGVIGYDVHVYAARIPALVLTLLIGAVMACSLAVAASTIVPNYEAAPAVVNAMMFPLVFISGTFFPISGGSFLSKIAGVFPVRHFIGATFAAFDPRGSGAGFAGRDLLVLGIWAVGGLLVAVRRFQWEPKRVT